MANQLGPLAPSPDINPGEAIEEEEKHVFQELVINEKKERKKNKEIDFSNYCIF